MAYQERTQSRDEYRPDKEFGVMYDPFHSDPTLIFTRLDDAVGMTINTGLQPHVSDFDTYYPWKGMERYNLDDAGNIYCKWGDTNFTDGNTSAYTCCVKLPKFYIKWSGLTGGWQKWWISPSRLPGYVPHPAFVRWNREVDCLWVGAYEAYVTGSKAYSRANQNLSSGCSLTSANWRTACSNIGVGWQRLDWQTWNALMMLWIIEYGPITANCQTIFNGCTASMRYTGYTGKNGPSGCQDAGPGHTRKMTVGSDYPFAYRGIENMWANVSCFLEGALFEVSTRMLWVHQFEKAWSDTPSVAQGFRNTGFAMPSTTGTRTNIQYLFCGEDASVGYMCNLPTTLGGSSTQYLCDGWYTPNWSNNKGITVGGGYDITTFAGLFDIETVDIGAGGTAHSRLEFVPRADNYYKV